MKKEDHADSLISIIESSELLIEIFHRAETLELGIYVIGAGCITQTVWNAFTGRPLGVSMEQGDKWHICAPFGLRDLFSLTVRPNKKLITKDLYDQKAAKWKEKWPELHVEPW